MCQVQRYARCDQRMAGTSPKFLHDKVAPHSPCCLAAQLIVQNNCAAQTKLSSAFEGDTGCNTLQRRNLAAHHATEAVRVPRDSDDDVAFF